MPTKWLQERGDGSKNGDGIPPHRGVRGSRWAALHPDAPRAVRFSRSHRFWPVMASELLYSRKSQRCDYGEPRPCRLSGPYRDGPASGENRSHLCRLRILSGPEGHAFFPRGMPFQLPSFTQPQHRNPNPETLNLEPRNLKIHTAPQNAASKEGPCWHGATVER